MMSWDWVIIALRFIQFGGAMILFGSSLLLLYGRLLPREAKPDELHWARVLLIQASLLLLIATPLQFILQTANLAGSLTSVFDVEILKAALFEMSFGKSSLARAILALATFLVAIISPANRRLFGLSAFLGALICASFAWMGHGAATEGAIGWVHLSGDIAHSLAAAGWLGALALFWVATRKDAPASITPRNLAVSLAAFAGAGTFFVAVMVASGLINSAFLVGWDIPKALSTRYGQLLAVKLLFFVGMLWLAAQNRFRLTPGLATTLQKQDDPTLALSDLRRSIRTEALLGTAIIAVIAWLGTLAPVTPP